MSVSRDFIDFYSPKARDKGAAERFPHGATERKSAAITLAFGFRARHYLGQTPVTIRQAGCFFLTLGEKSLDRLVQADRLIDLRAGAGAISAEPDEFLHIPISRHHLAGTGEDWQIGRIGGARHGARYRFQDVDGRIAPALGDGAFHHNMAV